MKKLFLITVILPVLCSCVRDGTDVDKCPLTVTCRDMTAALSEDALNIWGGYCSGSERIDMQYLENIDGGKNRIIPEIEGYTFVYLDPGETVADGPVHLTAWYTPAVNSLTIEYRSLANKKDIYTPVKLRGIPEGTVIDEDYLTFNGYLHDIENFFLEYYELTVIPGEGVVTVWYNPYYTLRVRYTNWYLDDFREYGIIERVKRGTNITLPYLEDLGLFKRSWEWTDDDGWHYWSYSTNSAIPSEDFFIEESMTLILRYYPSG